MTPEENVREYLDAMIVASNRVFKRNTLDWSTSPQVATVVNFVLQIAHLGIEDEDTKTLLKFRAEATTTMWRLHEQQDARTRDVTSNTAA